MAILLDLAAYGVVDFSQARLLDPMWRRKITLAVHAMVRRHQGELDAFLAAQSHSLAILALTGQLVGLVAGQRVDFTQTMNQLTELTSQVSQRRLPWAKKASLSETEMQTARQKWASVFGDPSDPVVQERIRQTIEAMRRGH